jgi:hypothetical protein
MAQTNGKKTMSKSHIRPIDYTSPAFQAEPLNVKLKRLEADFIDAEWLEDGPRLVALDYEIRMTRLKLELGTTHDQPF